MTCKLNLTKHGEQRCQQRGIQRSALGVVMEVGSDARDGVFVTKQNAKQAIFDRKKKISECLREIERHKIEISNIERLSGTLVVLKGDQVVTAYRPSRRQLRYQLAQ